MAFAPEAIYKNYALRLVGFRATLERTRMFTQAAVDARLIERKKVRAATRLAELCRDEEFRIGDKVVVVRNA